MRLDRPRVLPTTDADWDDDVRAIVTRTAVNSGQVLNVISTVARHPTLLKAWMPFGHHILGATTLPTRERELVILRTGYNAGSGYEWAQHVTVARRAGCSDDEIERVADGPGAPGWTDAERVLLQATDELMADDFVIDPTWVTLREHWSEQQCVDLVFTIGQYRLVSMALNTFGVQVEDGVELFPARLFADGYFNGR